MQPATKDGTYTIASYILPAVVMLKSLASSPSCSSTSYNAKRKYSKAGLTKKLRNRLSALFYNRFERRVHSTKDLLWTVRGSAFVLLMIYLCGTCFCCWLLLLCWRWSIKMKLLWDWVNLANPWWHIGLQLLDWFLDFANCSSPVCYPPWIVSWESLILAPTPSIVCKTQSLHLISFLFCVTFLIWLKFQE